jgi:hypothetical protein
LKSTGRDGSTIIEYERNIELHRYLYQALQGPKPKTLRQAWRRARWTADLEALDYYFETRPEGEEQAMEKHISRQIKRLKKENALLNKFVNSECLEMYEDMGGCPADFYATEYRGKLEICPGCKYDQKQAVKCWRETLIIREESHAQQT